ncbi:MAG: hypothetical protein ABFD46_01420 [Armatimonadota bacterium]
MKPFLTLMLILLTVASVIAADTTAPAVAPAKDKTVTIDVKDKPVADVLKDIAASTGQTILVEKLVDGKITASIKDTTVEKALDSITKILGIEWRKIQVVTGSSLAKDADALAAQMRTVLALKFPDMLISPAGAGGSFVHVQGETTAKEITKTVPSPAGFTTVYLVTDDEMAYKQELKDESQKKVAKYAAACKEMMEMFLSMTAEERAAALKESMGVMNQLGPEAMVDMMNSMQDIDPSYMAEMSKAAMQAMLSMDPEARKNMLRSQMQQQIEMMKSLSPEQLQQFQKDAAEVATEMMGGGGN